MKHVVTPRKTKIEPEEQRFSFTEDEVLKILKAHVQTLGYSVGQGRANIWWPDKYDERPGRTLTLTVEEYMLEGQS